MDILSVIPRVHWLALQVINAIARIVQAQHHNTPGEISWHHLSIVNVVVLGFPVSKNRCYAWRTPCIPFSFLRTADMRSFSKQALVLALLRLSMNGQWLRKART